MLTLGLHPWVMAYVHRAAEYSRREDDLAEPCSQNTKQLASGRVILLSWTVIPPGSNTVLRPTSLDLFLASQLVGNRWHVNHIVLTSWLNGLWLFALVFEQCRVTHNWIFQYYLNFNFNLLDFSRGTPNFSCFCGEKTQKNKRTKGQKKIFLEEHVGQKLRWGWHGSTASFGVVH